MLHRRGRHLGAFHRAAKAHGAKAHASVASTGNGDEDNQGVGLVPGAVIVPGTELVPGTVIVLVPGTSVPGTIIFPSTPATGGATPATTTTTTPATFTPPTIGIGPGGVVGLVSGTGTPTANGRGSATTSGSIFGGTSATTTGTGTTSGTGLPITLGGATPGTVIGTPTPTPPTQTPAPSPTPSTRGNTFNSNSTLARSASIVPSAGGASALASAGGLTRRPTTATGARSPISTPLASGVSRLATAGAKATARGQRTAKAATVTRPTRRPEPPAAAQPNVIERVVNVIPGFAWLLIGASVLLAAFGAGAAFWSGRRVRRQAGQFAAVSAAALTDSLTGLLNRRGFLEAADRELARARRYDRPFVLAYVDVRGLKAVNDTEGHLTGDRLLREAAGLLRDSARADDLVGRLGGDEMGLLLAEQDAVGAEAVTSRISAQVRRRRRALALRSDWDLTIGTAVYPDDGESVNELLAAADRRLYEQRGIALS